MTPASTALGGLRHWLASLSIPTKELVRRLGPQRSEMRVLYVPGYTDESIKDDSALDGAFLEKPFTGPGARRPLTGRKRTNAIRG